MPDQSSAATEHAILQEITVPLEGLPDDPLAIVEADFPVSLRGYDRVAVDEYVRQTRELVTELQATRSPESAVRRALERIGEQVSGVLQRAHESAEGITAQSRREAEDRLERARLEGKEITEAAEQRVKELDADTDRIWLERQRIVADAEDLAAQLVALAKVAAERFPTDEEDDESEGPVAAPYDDAALIAGTPVEAGAPEAEADPTVPFSASPDSEDETAPLPVTAEPDQPVQEPTDADPTARREGSSDAGREGSSDAGREGSSDAGREGSSDEDSTRVIRPASQAANRRRGGQ